MITTHHPLVTGYLQRLRAETADLPLEERAELVSSIAEHITTSLNEIPDPQPNLAGPSQWVKPRRPDSATRSSRDRGRAVHCPI